MTLRVVMLAVLLGSTALAEYVADGSWLKDVPARDHARTNPYVGQADAIAAGQQIYEQHCSHCHGENAEGTKKHPGLRSERIQVRATDGDIYWLLSNGNMRRGMPPWTKLPDQQRWQLISYLKSLHN